MAEGEAAPGFKLPEIEPGFDEWLRSQLEASPADEKDTDDFKYLTFSELPPFTDEHKSLMRKTMTPELFDQLKEVKSSKGYTLFNGMQAGVLRPHLGVGFTCGDEECFELFKDVINPIVQGWHGFDPTTQTHTSDLDYDKLEFSESDAALFAKYVKSTRVRAARNISGFSLPAGSSKEDRLAVEEVLKEAFGMLPENLQGTYYPLGELTSEQEDELQAGGFLFQKPGPMQLLGAAGAGRDWPSGRGIFHNPEKTVLCWCNEEDQCRIIAMENGGDVKGVFTRFCQLSNAIKEASENAGKTLMEHPNYGFLGTCPSNLGTGLRASVMIVLPRLNEDVHKLEEICAGFDLQPRGSSGEHSAAVGAKWDVSNKQRIGFTEVQLVQKMIDGVKKLIALEEELEAAAVAAAKAAEPPPPKKIIICGAPASGKGTQCERIVEQYGVVHISTGDVLRENVKNKTELGLEAKKYMEEGQLVPDTLMIDIVLERTSQDDCKQNGWLLDGFPRTGMQAAALEAAGIIPSHFILLDVPANILVERCTGRRSDPVTGKIYHMKFNPPPAEVAPRLIQRTDDTAEAMGKRIVMYQDNVDQVLPLYTQYLRKFDGTVAPGTITTRIFAFLDGEPQIKPKTRKIMIAGPPASGKGTQCEKIVEEFDLVHISTGDELRYQVKQNTPLGVQAKYYMDNGMLVPDELMVAIVNDRMSHMDVKERGWLLDGFPRTGAQAMALKGAGVEPDQMILLDVPDALLVERCVGRRSDPETGKIYHMTSNPPPAEIIPRLTQRSDDTAEAMGKRIKMYHDNVNSILDYYSSVTRKINGVRSQEEIFAEIKGFLQGAIPADMSGAPPRKGLPSPEQAQAFIKQKLQPFLVQALAALARSKPKEPLKFLATYLIENNPNNPKPPTPVLVETAAGARNGARNMPNPEKM